MKHTSLFSIGRHVSLTSAACATMLTIGPALAGDTTATEPLSAKDSALADWWNGKYMTGNWFGVRDTLADNGLKFKGKWRGAFYGVVDSQGGSRGFFDEELQFSTELNFGKLLKVDELKGVKGFATVRWRDPRGNSQPNDFVKASSLFNPSHYQSGTQWRLLTFGMEIGSANLLPVKDMIVLRAGWIRPQKEFIDQPLSKLFTNNAIESSKGVGGNIPFSSSFSTWGGTLKVKPVDWYYAKAGLFMAFPKATSTANHGLAFQGFEQDPSQNGLMVMAETGVTPKLGSAELPGKYAFGGYYFGVDKNSFNGTSNSGQYGFYWQADQMLFREASPEEPAPMGKGSSDGKSVAGDKSFKAPVDMKKPALSDQGLSMFSLFTVAPSNNNLYPFYFQTGLVYKGLIPYRDDDLLIGAIAYGSYSFSNIENLQQDGVANQPNYTMVLEGGYRFKINGWAFVQPFVQYIIKPNGTGAVQNATILGVLAGVNF
jgi:porin